MILYLTFVKISDVMSGTLSDVMSGNISDVMLSHMFDIISGYISVSCQETYLMLCSWSEDEQYYVLDWGNL